MASNYASYSSQYLQPNGSYGYARSPIPNEYARSRSYNDLSSALNNPSPYHVHTSNFYVGRGANSPALAPHSPSALTNRSPTISASNTPGQQPAAAFPNPPATLSRYRGRHIRAASMNSGAEDPSYSRHLDRYRNPTSNASISSSEISVDAESLQTQTSMSSVSSSQSWVEESVKAGAGRAVSYEKPGAISDASKASSPHSVDISAPGVSTIRQVNNLSIGMNSPSVKRSNDEEGETESLPGENTSKYTANAPTSYRASSRTLAKDPVYRSRDPRRKLNDASTGGAEEINKEALDLERLGTKLVLPSDSMPKVSTKPRLMEDSTRLDRTIRATPGAENSKPSSPVVAPSSKQPASLPPIPLDTRELHSRNSTLGGTVESSRLEKNHTEQNNYSPNTSSPGTAITNQPTQQQFRPHADAGVLTRQAEQGTKPTRSFGSRLKDLFSAKPRSSGQGDTEQDDDARSTISNKSSLSVRSVSSFMSFGTKFQKKKNLSRTTSNETTFRRTFSADVGPRGYDQNYNRSQSMGAIVTRGPMIYKGSPEAKAKDQEPTSEFELDIPEPPQPALKSTLVNNTPGSSRSVTPEQENDEVLSDKALNWQAIGLAPPNLGAGDIFPGSLKTDNVDTIVSSVERTGSFKRQPSTSRRTEEEVVPNAQEIEVDKPEVVNDAQMKLKSAMKQGRTYNSRKRSGATTRNSVSFASEILVYKTYSARAYDRRADQMTCNMLKIPGVSDKIRAELDVVKAEMPVHPDSVGNTHFFFGEN